MKQNDEKKIRRGSWVVTVPVVAVAVAYVVWFFLPQSKAIGELKDQTAEKQTYVENSGGLPAALEAARVELEKTQGYNAVWKKHAPKQRELAALFGRINHLAKEAGTVTTRFDPEPLRQNRYLREIPLTMGCRGTTAQVFEFIRGLESLPLAIWIEKVKIEKANGLAGFVNCEISLIVFAGNPEDSDYAINSD